MASSELAASLARLAIADPQESGEQSPDFPISDVGALATTDEQDVEYDLQTGVPVLFPDFFTRIQDNPASVVQELRSLVQERANETSNNTPDVQEQLDVLIHRLCSTLFLPVAQLGSNTWSTLLRSGLQDVVMDCILRDGFFEESKEFMYMVFDILSTCTHRINQGLGNATLFDDMLNRAPALWKTVYEHRHVFDLQLLVEHGLSNEDDLLEIAMVSVLLLHDNMHGKKWGDGKKAGPETYIPQLAFYLWMRVNRGDERLDKLVCAMGGIVTIPVGSATDEFVDNFVLPVVSPADLAARVYHQLKALSVNTEQNMGLFIRLANPIVPLFMTESLKPALDIHPILSLLVSVTDRVVRNHSGGMNDTERVATLQNFFIVHSEFARKMFARITHDLPEMGRVRGEDFITLLARVVDLMVSLGPQSEQRLRKDTPHFMRQLIRDCVAVIVDVQDHPNRHDITGGHTLVEGLKAGAQRDWWPALRKLYRSRDRAGLQSDRHSSLIARWKEFGAALGLTEEKERARYEREARRHCSWKQCEYHRDQVATSELKVCRGCGESRYCGQPCQKSDWTRGGHKQRCKRLKD